MPDLTAVCMPKWGLSMQEGAIVEWWKAEGAVVAEGQDLVDIETSKINNVYESPGAGVLRRILARPGETLPVGALLGVIAEPEISDAEVDAFVADFQANFIPSEDEPGAGSGLALSNVSVGGRQLRVARAGPSDGTPTVLIHGYSGDLNNWLFTIEALAAHGPVIALDLPGHGGSSKDVGDGSLSVLAGAAAGVLDALDVGEAHLVGHSLGAVVAARLAADRPGLARSLTLIAPVYLSTSPVSRDFLDGIIEAQRARDLKPVLEMLLADPSLVTKDMVDDMLKFKRLDGVEDALTMLRDRMLEGSDAVALRAALPTLSAAHIIASRIDLIVQAPDAAHLPPGWVITWVENAGHMPHLEKAAEVNAILLAARAAAASKAVSPALPVV